jgi:alpha-tubulin suppressor-like RCC1 family protein
MDFVQVCAGEEHSCALRADSSLLCWGENFNGEVGVGDSDARPRPAPVGQLSFARVACGGNVTCALGLEGTLYCWGDNFEGQLGQGDRGRTPDRNQPTRVPTDLLFQDVAVGQGHVCAVTRNGELYCWGRNTQGQLGVPNAPIQVRRPILVDPENLYRSVTAGQSHTCAIGRDRRLFCWGTEGMGYLGLGVAADTLVAMPTQVGTQADYVSVRANWFHTCALRSNGFLSCWGRNEEGQLGLADNADRDVPQRVGEETDWVALTAGHFHTCGFRAAQPYCWGENTDTDQQLGIGMPGRRNEPTAVELSAAR